MRFQIFAALVCAQDDEHSSLLLDSLFLYAHACLQCGAPLTGAHRTSLWPNAAGGGGSSNEQLEPALCRELWKFPLGACIWNESSELRVARANRMLETQDYELFSLFTYQYALNHILSRAATNTTSTSCSGAC